MGFFSDLFGDADDAAATYARHTRKGLKKADAFSDEAKGYQQQTLDQYGPYNEMLSNALGINGAEGGEAALGAYKDGSSYSLLQSVLDDATRRWGNQQSATGSLRSGRALEDLGRRTSDLTMGDYRQSWLSPLMTGTGYSQGALSNLSNIAGNQGAYHLGANQNIGTSYANAAMTPSPWAGILGTAVGGLGNMMTGGSMFPGLGNNKSGLFG